MLKPVSNLKSVLACLADGPADNHTRQLAQLLYETLYTILKTKSRTYIEKIFLVLFAALSFTACKTSSKNEVDYTRERTEIQHQNFRFPEPVGFINDFDDVFTADQEKDLEDRLSEYEQQTSNHISVVTVNSIEPYNEIQWYTTDLANYWRIGKKEKDNGLLIVLNNNEKEIWISTGLGTEKIITDEFLKNTIDSTIIPEFRNGNFHNGIAKGVEDIIVKWK